MFLSMAGLLVLALLGTMVETARFTLCENQGERGLFCATESLLAEYSRPLEKQYGLFGLESGGEAIDGQISDNDRTDQRTICQDVVDIIFSPVLGSLDPSIDQHNPFILCRFCRAGRKGEWAQAQDQRQDQSCHKKFFSTLFHRVFSFHTFISMV